MASIFIKGYLLKKHFINNSQVSYYIYQFQIIDNNDIYSIINIHSKQNIDIDSSKEIDLPITVSLNQNTNQIIYEFKKVVSNG